MQARMAIELTDVSKHFGVVRANDKVSLSIEAGTIHGIVGENGAGKSTLMSILRVFIQALVNEALFNDEWELSC